MNEVELFLLMAVLTQIFNTVDLVKFLEKNLKTSHVDCNGHIEGDITLNHGQKTKVKKSKNQENMGKTNTLPFNPWAVFATWLHIGIPQTI
jgi:hypothetical protein